MKYDNSEVAKRIEVEKDNASKKRTHDEKVKHTC